MSGFDVEAAKAICETVNGALELIYEHRRRHSPTREWHNRRDELDAYFIEQADAALNSIPAALAEIERLRALAIEACAIADELNGDNGDDEELDRRRKEIAAIRASLSVEESK